MTVVEGDDDSNVSFEAKKNEVNLGLVWMLLSVLIVSCQVFRAGSAFYSLLLY